MIRPLLPVLLLLPATGCVQATDRYPSLLPRAIESRSDAEVVHPAPQATPDAALDARIREQRAALERVTAAFSRTANEAEAKVAVARGLAAGSERWLIAQTALSELDTAQADTSEVISNIESIALDHAANAGAPYPALDALLAEARTVMARQAERLRGLNDALAPA